MTPSGCRAFRRLSGSCFRCLGSELSQAERGREQLRAVVQELQQLLLFNDVHLILRATGALRTITFPCFQVLEFRNVADAPAPSWSVFDAAAKQWVHRRWELRSEPSASEGEGA